MYNHGSGGDRANTIGWSLSNCEEYCIRVKQCYVQFWFSYTYMGCVRSWYKLFYAYMGQQHVANWKCHRVASYSQNWRNQKRFFWTITERKFTSSGNRYLEKANNQQVDKNGTFMMYRFSDEVLYNNMTLPHILSTF